MRAAGGRLWGVLGALLLLGAGLFWVGERWAQTTASRTAAADAMQLASSNASLFNSELQKFRILPVVLADYPDVVALLATGAAAASVNDRLERLADKTSAAAIYVIRPDGRTVAASNYRLPTSFIGQNYAFRPYFQDAMRSGDAELFALGTVSGRPGLYLARRIGDAGRPLGVIVVKIEFDALQTAWSRQAGTTMIADDHDIVIIAGRRDWQFRTLRPLAPAERAEIARSRLFEGSSLSPLPFAIDRSQIDLGNGQYRLVVVPVSLAGGRLLTLLPMDRAINGAQAQARIVVVSILFLLAAALAWQLRQRERAASQRNVQRDLEQKVAERTAELETINRLLVLESEERAAFEERYRRSREELAQANRLGTLGQVTAGVAHEINQPVAAIRAFAENSAAYLDRGKDDKARQNLQQIVSLTERIAAITSELRGFARRRTPAIAATNLADAIDAALLLLKHRITAAHLAIKWNRKDAQVAVRADRIRLEQVFVNLLQNSLDALAGNEQGRIDISVAMDADKVRVVVADNGPGLDPAQQARLFMPFSSGKEDGLGLGLAIVRDILREFGGEVVLLDGPGARFELCLAVA